MNITTDRSTTTDMIPTATSSFDAIIASLQSPNPRSLTHLDGPWNGRNMVVRGWEYYGAMFAEVLNALTHTVASGQSTIVWNLEYDERPAMEWINQQAEHIGMKSKSGYEFTSRGPDLNWVEFHFDDLLARIRRENEGRDPSTLISVGPGNITPRNVSTFWFPMYVELLIRAGLAGLKKKDTAYAELRAMLLKRWKI